MTILRQTIILNTLADNAADAFVDANGNLQITGAAYGAPKAGACVLSRQNAVLESLGIVTTTFTAVSGATYVLKVFGGNAIQGGYNASVKTYTYTATSTDTATTIGDVFRAFINADVNILNIVATGTTTLICTAKTGFAEIFCTTTTANTSIVQTNAGVPSVGQGTVLATDPSFLTSSTYGTFTAGATYTRWNIGWSTLNTIAAPSSNSTANNEYVVFINNAATSSGSNTAAMNLAFIQGSDYTYVGSIGGATISNGTICNGTLTALQAGLRAIITSPATTTAAVTVTTGAIALAGGAATFTTLGASIGDVLYVSVSGTTAFTTYGVTTVNTMTSATAGTGTCVTLISAGVFKLVQYKALPR